MKELEPFVIRELNNGDIGLYWTHDSGRQFLVRVYPLLETYKSTWKDEVLEDAESYLRERGSRRP